MQLSDEIINAFIKTLPNGEKDNSNGYELYYGTVKVSNGKTSVILDGSHVETPLNYLTMGAENGDRVTCIIKDHSLIVTGNLTHPSEGMTTKYIETMTVLAQEAAIGKLIATEGDFTKLTADSAFVKRLMSDQVGASILTADEAFIGSLQTKIVTADKIKAMQADIGYVDAETLKADYLQADMANLKIVEATKASIVNLLADMAFVKNATISQGHITGALDSVTLNANYITAGSLSVDRLYINGDDGKPRLVGFDEDGEPVATTIDASILTDRTVTADKIVANSITANEISTDFVTAFRADIMEVVTEDLHAVTAEIEKLISGDTEIDTLKLKEPLAEEYGGTGTTSFKTKMLNDLKTADSISTIADISTSGNLSVSGTSQFESTTFHRNITHNGDVLLDNGGINSPSIIWKSTNRYINSGVYNEVGTWYILDATNNKVIIESTKPGVNTFNGHAVSASNAANATYATYAASAGNAKSASSVAWTNITNAPFLVQTASNGSFTSVNTISKFSDTANMLAHCGNNTNWLWAVSSWSDRRLKKNIESTKINGLSIINRINLVEFDFKDKKYGEHKEIGYIAQELEDIVPDCVIEVPSDDYENINDGDTMLCVEDKYLIPYLVKSIQELTDEVNKLKEEIEKIKSEQEL